MIWQIFLVFGAMVALDFVWARYTQACAAKLRLPAAGYAALIMVFNGTVVLGYVHNAWMLIPAIAGAFVGTFLGIHK